MFLVRSRERQRSARIRLGYKLEGGVAFGRTRADHFFGRSFLRGRDDRNVCLDDAGLFTRDRFERFSQPGLMIVANRRNRRNDRRHCVGRIQSSAETGFEDDQFAIGLLEMSERQCGRDFKECRMRFPVADFVSERGQTFGDFLFVDHFAIHLDSFAVADEVRGGEETGAITLRAANGIDHRTDGTLAVRAGNVNDALIFRGKIEILK